MVSVAVPVWKERYKMDERNGHHISRFIYPECANELLRQFRFKSKEEVRETVEYVLEGGNCEQSQTKTRSEELKPYSAIYAEEIRDLASRFIVPAPKKTTHCIACGKKIEYEGQCPKKCPDCKGMK
jgi:hypothetical protein